MRMVITGAPETFGLDLQKTLQKRCEKVVFVRHNTPLDDSTDCTHPSSASISILTEMEGADIVVHLGKGDANSDPRAADEEVALIRCLATEAQRLNVKRFINVIQTNVPVGRKHASFNEGKKARNQAGFFGDDSFFVNIHMQQVLVGSQLQTQSAPQSFFGRIDRKVVKNKVGATYKENVLKLADWLLDQSQDTPKIVGRARPPNQDWLYAISKRLFDLVAAFGGLVALAPLIILTWFLIRRQGDGPAFFAQERVGIRGQLFTCYKFRTMAVGTVQAGTHEVSGQAITPLGGRLRRWKIDELPQLWNVLTGEMSVIGPRPCLPTQKDLIQRRKEAGVLDVKPGISGLAQVKGVDMSDPARLVEWDVRYLAIRSLTLDLKLILMTLKGSGRGDNVAL